ncbi:hypothetical protein PILCRDRAFT_3403 [Piloderma croceum F 1598]|uniref:DUF6533 domain-containing protein n=1 Tax=Piloderma croceum (strain F 1598) TaxID=765440 RepID=A0A0C3BPJ0_PILCF|nr:hypothetical protein PILCRDRAFT_3403 [Piloderma croceum F 1598]
MVSSNNTIPTGAILNPYTPLAFLPPDVADQFQIICYVNVATLSALTWDWLMAIPEEYKIIRKVGFSKPNITYLLSRNVWFLSINHDLQNCMALKYVEGVFLEIGVPATSLLFLFRVRAVYNNSRIITAFFGLLWMAISGLSVLILLGVTRDRIPYTQRCTEGPTPKYSTVPIIVTAVNDTLVFLAISYRMISSAMVSSTWKARAKSFITGDGLLHLSKALLKSGQVYYFATIGVAISMTALIFAPGIPGTMKPVLGSVYFALSGTMACRVYRELLLGTLIDPQLNTTNIVSFYGAASDIRDHDASSHDCSLSRCSSKLAIDVGVETHLRGDAVGYAL